SSSWTPASSGIRSCGRARALRSTCSAWRPPSSRGSRARAHSTFPPTNLRSPNSKEPSMQATEKIWMNGELVDWADAKVHVASHGLNYGSGVFEGIRCYDTAKGPAVFRLEEHLVRFENSARILYMDLPFSTEELRAATHDVVAINGNASCYIRPLALYGYGELGVSSVGNPVDVAIISFPWGAYLGEDSQTKGITAKISTWERVGPNVIPHAAKATGIYLNSMLATMEARRGGYDEAIMLSHDGYV